MNLSREAIEQGMYIEPFADQRVFAIGLEPPPMMWIFEWDILTGDSAVLDVIYAISRDATGGDIEAAIAGGEQAVADVEAMRELVAATDAATWRDASLRDAFLGTLDYEVDVLHLLAAYRAMILYQGEWHDTLAPIVVRRVVATRATSTSRSRPRTSRRTTATSTTRRTTSRPPTSASSAPTAISRWRGSRASCSLLAARVARHRHGRGAHAARPPARRGGGARVLARLDPSVAGARVDARRCCRSTGGS